MAKDAGELIWFALRALREAPGAWRYASEVLRQAGILIVGSALVVWLGEYLVGLECGVEGVYIFRGYGASSYAGVLTALCSVREMGPMMLGWFFAAKVGCGFAAELGAMRITNELDAMESIGVDTMRYVVGTRLVAVILTIPGFFFIGLVFAYLGHYTFIVKEVGAISQAVWGTVHWQYQSPTDLLYSFVKGTVFVTTVALVSLFYGYRASGGPVGVGQATAMSMLVNLILIQAFNAVMTPLFWGVHLNYPIGG